ncbi:proton-conducting transporter membrane subunit [Dermacoccaceae bacterium W4C1]
MVIALLASFLVPLAVGSLLVAGDRFPRPVGARTAAGTALAAAVVAAACAVIAAVERPSFDRPWISMVGLRAHFGVDGLSAGLLVMSALVGVFAVLYGIARPPAPQRHGTFLGCLLLVTGGAVAAFSSADALLFVLAAELTLVPAWYLIRGFAAVSERSSVATTFAGSWAIGGVLVLIGVLGLIQAGGATDLSMLSLSLQPIGDARQVWLAAAILLGAAIQSAVFGVHGWAPRAFSAPPAAASMVLAGVLPAFGGYAMLRLVLGPLPHGAQVWSPVCAVLGGLGALVAALMCFGERSWGRLAAWAGIGQLGFVVLAISAGTSLGVQAAVYGLLAHAAVTVLLFTVAGEVQVRGGGAAGDRATLARAPRLRTAQRAALGAVMALPLTGLFWSQLLTLLSLWSPQPGRSEPALRLALVLAALGAAATVVWAVRGWGLGEDDEQGELDERGERDVVDDLSGAPRVVLAAAVLAVIALGVAFTPLLALSEAAAQHLVGGR